VASIGRQKTPPFTKALESDFKFNIIKIENGVIQQIGTV